MRRDDEGSIKGDDVSLSYVLSYDLSYKKSIINNMTPAALNNINTCEH